MAVSGKQKDKEKKYEEHKDDEDAETGESSNTKASGSKAPPKAKGHGGWMPRKQHALHKPTCARIGPSVRTSLPTTGMLHSHLLR